MNVILGILLIVLMVCMVVLTAVIAAYFITETSINIKRDEWYGRRDE